MTSVHRVVSLSPGGRGAEASTVSPADIPRRKLPSPLRRRDKSHENKPVTPA